MFALPHSSTTTPPYPTYTIKFPFFSPLLSPLLSVWYGQIGRRSLICFGALLLFCGQASVKVSSEKYFQLSVCLNLWDVSLIFPLQVWIKQVDKDFRCTNFPYKKHCILKKKWNKTWKTTSSNYFYPHRAQQSSAATATSRQRFPD